MAVAVGIVGIVGAGTMGAGIAQVALEAGWEVVIDDIDDAAVEAGRERIRRGLERRAAKLDLDPESADDWVEGRLGRVRRVPMEGMVDEAELIIESALEDLDLKRTIFRALDGAADPELILATNTSALSVAEIAEETDRPERVIGLHFFNPAPLMALVEVVAPPLARRPIVVRASEIITAWGKTPVVCTDSPGFIVNRVNRPYTIEALRILEAEQATVEGIDAALRAEGYPMGPFELMDLTGIDVTLAAATGIWERLGRPERLRPSPIQQGLVEAGDLGRKAGRGFYRYKDGQRTGLALDVALTSGGLSPQTISDRILDAVGDEARLAVEEGVASPDTIDLAMRLGAAHPKGPFERAAGRG